MRNLLLFIALIVLSATFASRAADSEQQIVSLYQQQKYDDCLAAIEPRRVQGPLSLKLLSASAHCKMALGNMQGARAEYTQALTQAPLTADLWLGRAQCELAMGSIRDAEADFSIGTRIDPKAIEPFKQNYTKLLAAAKQVVTDETPAALWTKFVATQRADPDQKVLDLAMRITRLRNAERHLGDEDFTRADALYALSVRDSPNDIEALLDEATFLLNPTISRRAILNGKAYPAKVTVHDAEPARAEELLARAMKIDPNNARAMAQMAQLCIDTGRHAQAFDWADKALAAGEYGVDICRMHLIGGTNVAQALSQKAALLRQPTVRLGDRIEGNRRVQTTFSIPPSPEALAEAARLEAKSDEFRRNAVAPLLKLIERTKASAAPADQVIFALANAYESEWRTHYDEAIRWANKAVEIEPFQAEALLLLVQLCTNMHYEGIAHQAQARANSAMNPASGITLDGVWPLMRQGQFAEARKILAQADREDPGAIGLACARFAMAQEEGKLDDAISAARLANAMNLARVMIDGRSIVAKPPAAVAGADIVIPAYTFAILGRMLNDAGRADEALAHFNRAIALGAQVPAKELSVTVPDTAVPNDKLNAPAGTYLQAVLGSAHRQAGELLMRGNKPADAAPHLLAAAQAGDATPQLPFMAYRCYKTVGLEGFHGQIPAAWRDRFAMWDQQHVNVAAPENPRENLDLQIDQITRRINQGVGQDELRELTAKRDELIARREKLGR